MFRRMATPPLFLPEPSKDPALGAYPPTLPVEIALKTASIKDLCAEYEITYDEWQALKVREDFRADVKAWIERLKEEGMSFRAKAQLQAEQLLITSWKMIHGGNEVPPAVKADLIKFTIRVAGLDASAPNGGPAGGGGTALQININL
jgi:hypothetical protein